MWKNDLLKYYDSNELEKDTNKEKAFKKFERDTLLKKHSVESDNDLIISIIKEMKEEESVESDAVCSFTDDALFEILGKSVKELAKRRMIKKGESPSEFVKKVVLLDFAEQMMNKK